MTDYLSEISKLNIVRALAIYAAGNVTVKQACEKAGISDATLYRALEKQPEIISSFIAEEHDKILEEYDKAALAHRNARNKIYEEALREDLSLNEALVLESRIRKMISSMETQLSILGEPDKVQATPEQQSDGEKFLAQLTGPNFERKKGKATIQQTTTTFELEFDDDNEQEIIEGETLD